MEKIKKFFNFDNIGGKIKNFVKWCCWISIIVVWIASVIMFFNLISNDYTASLCWIPMLMAAVYPFVIWVGSWAMYAFGELVEDIHAIRNKECPVTENNNLEVKDFTTNATNNKQVFSCPKCNNPVYYGDPVCILCGQKFDWTNM